jgi:hypothetical protein
VIAQVCSISEFNISITDNQLIHDAAATERSSQRLLVASQALPSEAIQKISDLPLSQVRQMHGLLFSD